VKGGRFVEEGLVRAVCLDFPGDERPRDLFRPAEDDEDEEAHGEGAGGGAFGEQGQREQRRRDARERPPVPFRTRHVRASVAARMVGRAFREGDKREARKTPGD
jgi:hypothetical protein